MGKTKKDNKTKKKQKTTTQSSSSQPDSEQFTKKEDPSTLTPISAHLTPFSADSDFAHAWALYGTSYMDWTKSILALQSTVLTTALSWSEMCRKTLELDTELLKSLCTYWEKGWQNACTDSATSHLKSTVSAAAQQAGAIRNVQTDLFKEYSCQWKRLFEL